ncbi:MAG: Uracil DNA glycosylase superfamily protein [Parcubacteria group bacterium ADurb.Bin247]|jgi:DNA polymerase|nr:MAG: Uracil DNA glycosylase superfamily protein [Parcubacteria group bacterium ADurb.Bin247]
MLEMEQIKEDVLKANFNLAILRRKNNLFPVIGEGNHNAEIMFIGEAPGRNEAISGRPFCGKAGQVLDNLLSGINISRSDVYITNIVKDRPPNNRDPLPEEIEEYAPFLDRQIKIIKPKIIVTLGRFSAQYILSKYRINNTETITKINGKVFEADGLKIITLLHPASAIYDNKKQKMLVDGFNIVNYTIKHYN